MGDVIRMGPRLPNRPWTEPTTGILCGSVGCEFLDDYEGECTASDCDGTEAKVIYRHSDPDYRCPCHGDRICVELGAVIDTFACKTCGLIQDPEPEATPDGQFSLF